MNWAWLMSICATKSRFGKEINNRLSELLHCIFGLDIFCARNLSINLSIYPHQLRTRKLLF